jgi:hypothetical protein
MVASITGIQFPPESNFYLLLLFPDIFKGFVGYLYVMILPAFW